MKRWLVAALLLAGCRSCSDDHVGTPPPTASFQCGRQSCRPSQYCSLVSPQVPPNMIPVTHTSCVDLPAGCERDASCECLARHGVQGTCRNLEGGLRVALRKPPAGG